MLDRHQVKEQGLRCARALQVLFKTVSLFSVDHATAQVPFKQSFELMNAVIRENGQLTIGFVDQRVMLNNVLTAERSLTHLESEFMKRGIRAVSFQAGITLTSYKQAMSLLTKPPKVIQEQGGVLGYLARNPIQFLRVYPADKSDKEDTVLEMGSESFLMKKPFSEARPAEAVFESLESLLQASGFAGAGGGGAVGDGGMGPGPGAGGPGVGSGPGMGPGEGAGVGLGPVIGPDGGVRLGGGPETGDGPGWAASGGVGLGPGSGGGAAPPRAGGPVDIARFVEGYFNSTLMESTDTPHRSYLELARIIRDMRPELVLSSFSPERRETSFSPERREQLRALPPDQMAAEIIEDTAVRWAGQRLAKVPTGPGALVVEEEVVRVLLRTLQATQVAERLAQKLAQFVKDVAMPRATYERIQEELRWVTVPSKDKEAKLLQLGRFDRSQFRRLLEHIRDLVQQNDPEGATRLGTHYLSILDFTTREPDPEELSRIPELFSTMAAVRTEFWPAAAVRLSDALKREPCQESQHRQIVNAILALCRTLAVYEDFAPIHLVGSAMERLVAKKPEAHGACCAAALAELLPPTTVERLIEVALAKRDDPSGARAAADLLRWSGSAAISKVLQQLVDEQVAGNRLQLIRLIRKLGPPAVELTRQLLTHERWYVVRNACKLLGELKDPELLQHLPPALCHSDERVQKAAVKAITESRAPGCAQVLAEALPLLHPHLAEEVLGELCFLKDPATVPPLERFIFREAHGTQAMMLGVQALAVIPGERVQHLLGNILSDNSLDLVVRRIAMIALIRSQTPFSRELLQEFAAHVDDPMASECKLTLQALGPSK